MDSSACVLSHGARLHLMCHAIALQNGDHYGDPQEGGAFLPERQSLENPKMPEGGGKKAEQKS